MYYFIVNPCSRTGKGEQIWPLIQQELNRRDIPFEVYFTEYAGHATELAKSICESHTGIKKIVMLGGDGTANEVINGLKDYSEILLGYIPVGSGNDLARGLKLPTEPLAALERILSPKHYLYVDHGLLTYYDGTGPRRFGVSSGIGYDADVCYEVMHSKLKKFLNKIGLGKLTYYLIAVKQIFKLKPADMEILIDGQKKLRFKNTLFVASMIQKYEGGGLKLAPDADCTDGRLTLCAAYGIPKLKLFLIMPSVLFAKHTRFKGVEIIHCSSVEMKADRPLILHVDGEYAGAKDHVRLTCMPEQIRMYV